MTQGSGLPEIDDVAENNVNNTVINDTDGEFLEDSPKPMPNRLKYSLMVLPIALIVGIFAMNFLKGSGDQVQIDLDGKEMQVSSSVVAVSGSSSSDQEVLNKDSSAEKSDNGKLKLGMTPMQLMQEQLESISSQMQVISGSIDELEKQGIAVGELKTKVSTMEEQLKHVPIREELEKVKSDFATQIEIKAVEIKNSLSGLYKKAKRTVAPIRSRKLNMPFRLVSIDQWDGVNYAAIQSSNVGGIENLREGDSRSGWVVSRIDSMKMAVTFQHTKSGKKVIKNTI